MIYYLFILYLCLKEEIKMEITKEISRYIVFSVNYLDITTLYVSLKNNSETSKLYSEKLSNIRLIFPSISSITIIHVIIIFYKLILYTITAL